MYIKKIFKTSKGLFWSKDDADLKSNRQRIFGSRPGDPKEYEQVEEAYVLCTGISDEVFELKCADVK